MKIKAVLKNEVKNNIREIGTFKEFYEFLTDTNKTNSNYTALAVDRSNDCVHSLILSHVDGPEYVVYDYDRLEFIGIISSPFGCLHSKIDKNNFKNMLECFDFYIVEDSDLVKFLNK